MRAEFELVRAELPREADYDMSEVGVFAPFASFSVLFLLSHPPEIVGSVARVWC